MARQHQRCGCGGDFCRHCNPEYSCMYCGLTFVDMEEQDIDPDTIPCQTWYEKEVEMDKLKTDPVTQRNQCDGCMAGMPIEDGVHINVNAKGYDRYHMVCERDLYQDPSDDLPF